MASQSKIDEIRAKLQAAYSKGWRSSITARQVETALLDLGSKANDDSEVELAILKLHLKDLEESHAH